LPNRESTGLPGKARRFCLIAFLILMTGAASATGQATSSVSSYYARTNTFSVFGAYSGDSSHILLGDAENRRLLDFGVAYGRKLFVNRLVNWQYNGELLPVALESDPVVLSTYNWTSPTVYTESGTEVLTTPCVPSSGSFSTTQNGKTYSYTYTFTCSRQWTIGEGISPVGFQWNFRPRRKQQPFFIGHGGYMYSTQSIPVPQAGSFNFTFDFGAGFELYCSKTRSVRAEYRYHHISNHDTANQNPGIDNGLFQVTYSFGR
jgi:opacity protein-like surface antigen